MLFSDIETSVWLNVTCEGGTASIHNLSAAAGGETITLIVDGDVVYEKLVSLNASQMIEKSLSWAEMGISPPIVENHSVVIRTDDDQASASVGPCVGLGESVAHKFDDANGNGVQDKNEEDIEGWLMRLYSLDDGLELVAEGNTDNEGNVTFGELPPGRYKMWEEKRECWAPTTPTGMNQWNGGYYAMVDLSAGQQITVDLGSIYTCAAPLETCIDLEKSGPAIAESGETVTYHFWVHNCGDIILSGGAQVYDLLFGDDPIWDGDLAPGEAAEFDRIYTLPSDCGPFTNYAWAVGYLPGYPRVRDDDDWTVDLICPEPAIDVEKFVSVDRQAWYDADDAPGPEVEVGQGVSFRFAVTNTGNVTLTGVHLEDSDFDVSECAVVDPLESGDSFECVVGPFEAELGRQTNRITVTGDYDGQTYADQDAAHYLGYILAAPSIDVEKHVVIVDVGEYDADNAPGPEVEMGQGVSFRFAVTNTGNVTLTGVHLEDSDFDVSECAVVDPLESGDSFECVVGPFEAELGRQTNRITVTGDYDGQTYADQDAARYLGVETGLEPSARADLAISLDYETYFVSIITYTIVARNLGPEDADGAIISDTFPSHLNVKFWTCVASGGASCLASGSGDVLYEVLPSFPAGGIVTYTAWLHFDNWNYFADVATVTPPPEIIDPNEHNNRDSVHQYMLLFPLIFKNATLPMASQTSRVFEPTGESLIH